MVFLIKAGRSTGWSRAAFGITLLVAACAAGKPIEGALEGQDFVALRLDPPIVQLDPGTSTDFSVTVELSDGSQNAAPGADFSATGGTINGVGHYTAGPTPGDFRVIATLEGKSDTSLVRISDVRSRTLVSLVINPAGMALEPGGSQAFLVSGVLSDGADTALTVDWTATGGTISPAGFYVAPNQSGTFLVVAHQQGGSITDTARVTVASLPATLTTVELTPASVSLQFNQTQQFTAVGRLTDGSTTAIAVTWSATGGAITNSGLYAAGNTAGNFRVIARAANGMADTSAVTITATTVTALNVQPASIGLQSGQAQQFTVSATLSNGNTQNNPVVTWSATGGTITTGGLYTAGLLPGSYRVIAVAGSGVADTSAVDISLAVVTGLSVAPASATVQTGATRQFTATAILSNGGTQLSPLVNWSATGGTVTGSGLYTAGSAAGNFQVTASLVGGLLSASANLTLTVAPPSNMYFNSAEAGCGTDPNALFCDDFEDGDWYSKDCDQANSSGGLLQTDGWCGNIYANPITPAGSAVCGNRGFRSNCAASSGNLTSQQGRNMAEHGFVGGAEVNESYFRLYFQPQSDYAGGHEKMFDFTRGVGTGQMVALCYNYFSNQVIRCMPYLHQDDGLPGAPAGGAWMGSNVGAELTLTRGHWYFIEMHVRLNTPGSYDGLFEWWMNDCGTDGSACTGTPTMRGRFTNVKFRNTGSEASVQIGGNWIENWANAPSQGTLLYDNVRAGKTQIGFVP